MDGYKPLWRCDVEELAATRQARPSGGVLFARNQYRDAKDVARRKIIDLFTLDAHPGFLSILSMPGLHWRFERKLLGKREGNWFQLESPLNTNITAVENDRFIYYSAAHQMPGLHTIKAGANHLDAAPFAERTVKTKFIAEFHFANVDDVMAFAERSWDAAWLDYTGPLSVDRLELIAEFYKTSVRNTLVVTALKARHNRKTANAIRRAGGHSEWLREYLSGEVLHDIEYFDTSPMAQFAVRHPGYKENV